MKFNKRISDTVIGIVIVLAFVVGFTLPSVLSLGHGTGQLPREFDSLIEVWTLLRQDYVNQSAIDPEILAQGAIDGMLEALGDPYTAYYYDYEEFNDYLEGQFEGIGVFFSIDDGILTVVSPIKGSPADNTGIKAGDIILEVDGESTLGFTDLDAITRIRGPKGTTVTLLIQHEGEDAPVEIQIVRDTITEPSVYYESLSDNIGYIQITHFASSTANEFKTALVDLMDNGSEGLVIDLRENPGGFLDTVSDIADELIDTGIILYVANDDLEVSQEYTAEPGGLAVDIPLAVLVDGGSASGSEVLAGALQDHERAVIIGTLTFGKGSVDSIYELQNGSALYLTTSRWLTPDKHLIEGIGITPDFLVEIGEEDATNGIDTQLNFAIEYLQSQTQP